MACIGLLPAPACLKPLISANTKCLINTILTGTDEPSAMAGVVGEPGRFVVAFCGSGTGHLTQAMKVVEMLQERGCILTGVVTDTDASPKMLDEMVKPLLVGEAEGQLLIIPAIELVDTEKGFTPLIAPQRFVGSLLAAQESLHNKRVEYANFFKRARCERIYSMYHLTLARFLQLNPLPPSVTCVHMAAQFGLCLLPPEDTPTIIEVGTKAVMDLMRDIFAVSGEVAPIGPQGGAGVLPPIIHVPAPLEPQTPKLVLCYFLVKQTALSLDAILAANPMPGVEFHCFTASPLEKPASQLQSHQKQRKLFQQLFARCTAVIVSAGNETVWEAVCRGVPVLTVPTEGHGEQLLNAAVHARNFPHLVRSRPKLDVRDVRWLTNYNLDDPSSVAESKRLRKMVMDFNEQGSPLLKVPNLETPRTAMREGIKRRVSGLLESAQALVTGGSSSR